MEVSRELRCPHCGGTILAVDRAVFAEGSAEPVQWSLIQAECLANSCTLLEGDVPVRQP